MIQFKIIKTSKKSRARLGFLETPHGTIETPSLVPVATQAAVKTLSSEEVLSTKTQVLIANTFHLHDRPGEKIVQSAGGLHAFMNWKKPLMTDSGGFQVFSMGFGKDHGVGKVLKMFPGKEKSEPYAANAQPRYLKITDEGVRFRSFVDGRELFLGPKESIRIQELLGADIIFAFDECTSPLSSPEYIKKSLERTHRWARECIKHKKSNQALFGIVQGSSIKNLREESARYINSLGFDGFGIGGDLGKSKKDMMRILGWAIPHLDPMRPRHLLGIGYVEDIKDIIQSGIDLFDCTVPTHYARNGVAFTKKGKLNLARTQFCNDKKPIDKTCVCPTCQNYSRMYLSHLFRANEITGGKLLTIHNLFFYNSFVERLREKIKQGRI
ncbi:MAG: tRNA guanosine(34) transglycosylase Tgt [Candidatus Colwellbacteria bacterium]|nr:tRNA guanosine(34) transglycosylase Tgt [Candidatus Colwellbacteria bacterium]